MCLRTSQFNADLRVLLLREPLIERLFDVCFLLACAHAVVALLSSNFCGKGTYLHVARCPFVAPLPSEPWSCHNVRMKLTQAHTHLFAHGSFALMGVRLTSTMDVNRLRALAEAHRQGSSEAGIDAVGIIIEAVEQCNRLQDESERKPCGRSPLQHFALTLA